MGKVWKLNSLPENNYKIEEKLIDELESIYLDPDIDKIPYISYSDLLNLLLIIKKYWTRKNHNIPPVHNFWHK